MNRFNVRLLLLVVVLPVVVDDNGTRGFGVEDGATIAFWITMVMTVAAVDLFGNAKQSTEFFIYDVTSALKRLSVTATTLRNSRTCRRIQRDGTGNADD